MGNNILHPGENPGNIADVTESGNLSDHVSTQAMMTVLTVDHIPQSGGELREAIESSVHMEEGVAQHVFADELGMCWVNLVLEEPGWGELPSTIPSGFKMEHKEFGKIAGKERNTDGSPNLDNFTFFIKGGGSIVRKEGHSPVYSNLKRLKAPESIKNAVR